MAFSRRTLSVATVVILLALLAGGAWLRVRSNEGDDEASGSTADAVESDSAPAVSATEAFATDVAQPVSGARVRRDTLWITVSAAGQAAANRRAVVRARVGGVVSSLPLRESDRVSEGDLLLRFDTTNFALAVDRARAEVRNAEAQYRELTLFDEEITDPELRAERERLARARSGLEQAEVTLREAELDLERASVRAPFGGRVANLNVVEGQHVSQGTELLTLVELDPIKVEVQVLEAEVGRLEEGRGASVTFAAFPGETFRGRVETINPVVDPESRTARVTLSLPNPDGRIKPGMYADVSLDARRYPDRIVVPRSAILERDRRTMLFVFEASSEGATEGRAQWRYVTTGLESDSLVSIVEGEETDMVEPGETVLVDGHHYLVHDARVRLVDEVPDDAPRGAGR